MCGPTRRQVLLAGAALPLLPRLPRRWPAVALGGVEVQPRSAWGGDLKPKGPMGEEAPADVRFLLVHHTASANGYGRADVAGQLRGFYGFHTTDKKWPDLAYNFLVDRFGQVWEGRTGSLAGPVKGDATGGSQGFAQLACFIGNHDKEPPSAEALDAMGRLLGALAARYAIDVHPGATASFVSRGSNLHPAGAHVTTPTIAGHREMSKTTCPGDACYPLVRSRLVPAAVAAAGLVAPTPAAVPSPAADPAAVATTAPAEALPPANPGGALDTTAPAPVSPPPATFRGGARHGSGAPVAGLVTGAAGGAVLAAGGLAALVLRRRANARESGDWEQARTLDPAGGDGRQDPAGGLEAGQPTAPGGP
jgi:hypothetical protein